MEQAPNSLLQPGAGHRWAAMEAAQRRALTRPHESVEQRLERGQRLSAQAAQLRRSVVDAGAVAARS